MNVTNIHTGRAEPAPGFMRLTDTTELEDSTPCDDVFRDYQTAMTEYSNGVHEVVEMIASTLAARGMSDDLADHKDILTEKDLRELIDYGHAWDRITRFVLRVALAENRFCTISMLSMWSSLSVTLFSAYLKEFGHEQAAARYDLACEMATGRVKEVLPDELSRIAMLRLRTGSA